MAISKIKLITDPIEIHRLYEFIKKFPLDYPNYEGWTQKCYEEMLCGGKKAVVWELEGKIVGNLIFQKHKQDPRVLELKNGRIEEPYQRRNIMSRLIKKAEEYARQEGYKRIIGDAHEENTPIIRTLKKAGFFIESVEELYDSRKEVILVKEIK